EIPRSEIEPLVETAYEEAAARNIRTSDLTPFLLSWISARSEGRSLTANRALLANNAAVAADLAVTLER
ncbi:MAG: pseudouridine-5'-phosphate glycosidase, partial [Rhodothermales bacterium]